jgi:thiamine-phosphate pyrophosphorylase
MSVLSRLTGSVKPCDFSLYLVANLPSFRDRNLFFSKIQKAVAGGVSCVQLRDDRSDYPTRLGVAVRLREMLKGVPLFINTRDAIKLAREVGAEGVYLEEGSSYLEARQILGEEAIIGIPVRSKAEVMAANQTRAINYLSAKVFRSDKTCPRNDALLGIEGLKEVCATSHHPVVAIGGLKVHSVEEIYCHLRCGDGIAMAGGLMDQDDPGLIAQNIRAIRRRV